MIEAINATLVNMLASSEGLTRVLFLSSLTKFNPGWVCQSLADELLKRGASLSRILMTLNTLGHH